MNTGQARNQRWYEGDQAADVHKCVDGDAFHKNLISYQDCVGNNISGNSAYLCAQFFNQMDSLSLLASLIPGTSQQSVLHQNFYQTSANYQITIGVIEHD